MQRLEKVMQDAGIKLTCVASQLLTKSGPGHPGGALGRQDDPARAGRAGQGPAAREDPRPARGPGPPIPDRSPRPRWSRRCSPTSTSSTPPSPSSTPTDRAAAPFAESDERVCTIPGVSAATAVVLLAECGADMTVFPTAAHLASWAGICPGTTPPAAEPIPAVPGTARSRCAPRSPRPRTPPHGRKTPTSPRTTPTSAAGPAQGHRRHPPRPTDRLLARRARPGRLHRPRPGLGPTPPLHRTPHEQARCSTGSPRSQRPHRTRHHIDRPGPPGQEPADTRRRGEALTPFLHACGG